MGILLIKRPTAREIPWMRRRGWAVVLLMASGLGAGVAKAGPAFTVDDAVATARKQNPEILMAAKQLEAAKGGVTEARSGFLPGVVSTGLLRKRETVESSRLQNSELHLAQLIGLDASGKPITAETSGQLQYAPKHPDLSECLAYADVQRPEIRARQIDVEIEEAQLILDQSASRPRVEAFAGYEVYSERDPEVGPEFNHGWVIGLNGTWHIFDGYATGGRM